MEISSNNGDSIMNQSESIFNLHKGLIPEIESVFTQHHSFARKARDNAQKMLFFFGLCLHTGKSKTNKIIDEYRAISIKKIMELTFWPDDHHSSVLEIMNKLAAEVDSDWTNSKKNLLKDKDKIESWLGNMGKKFIESGEKNKWRPLRADLLEIWNCHLELDLWRQIVNLEPLIKHSGKEADKYNRDWNVAHKRVEKFLAYEGSSVLHRLSRKIIPTRTSLPWKAIQVLRNVPAGIQKHLTIIIALGLSGYIVFGMEAVNSLIRNMGLWAAIPFGIALLPLVINKIFIWSKYAKRHIIPSWDVGGIPHRSWRKLAKEPDRFFERWPRSLAEPGIGFPKPKVLIDNLLNLVKRLFWGPKYILDVVIKGQIQRLIWYLLGWITGVIILYIWVSFKPDYTTYLTVFLIVIFLYALILIARLIDFWDYLEPKPIRFHLLLYAVIGIFALAVEWGRWFFILAFLGWSVWFTLRFFRRPGRPFRLVLAIIMFVISLGLIVGGKTLQQAAWKETADGYDWRNNIIWPIPGNDPVVVLAASGGGSRAALYTALTLEKLDKITVVCRKGNMASKCPFSEFLQAISSVSGGSLANAGYVARRLAGDLNLTNLKKAVSDDFILEILWGVLNPRSSRGDSLEKKWQGLKDLIRSCSTDGRKGKSDDNTPIWGKEGMALGGICLSHVARTWRQAVESEEKRVPFPMPIFNTATLDSHDVVITPLPKEYYISAKFGSDARNLKDKNLYKIHPLSTWVYYRDGIYGLEDLMGKSHDPLLSSAVRASANFPFGFPLVALETTRPLFLHPDWTERCKKTNLESYEQKTVYLTDGGALSNSGMWSLFRLLINRSDEGLIKRGVLLIIVDASKMDKPEDPDKKIRGLRSSISAQAPIGQYLHRTMFDLLEAVYGNGIAISQIDLDPQKKNIHTTWTLDSGTRGELEMIFEDQWSKMEESLLHKWEYLYSRSLSEQPQNFDPPKGLQLIDRDRPPMD
jgi:mRNA-degrading endonuclease YafQ of YafQ-DinJ toxin-antitoxin module